MRPGMALRVVFTAHYENTRLVPVISFSLPLSGISCEHDNASLAGRSSLSGAALEKTDAERDRTVTSSTPKALGAYPWQAENRLNDLICIDWWGTQVANEGRL